MEIDSNEDPSLGLSCCDYEKEYYNDQSQLCESCKSQPLCADSSSICEGEKTTLLTCIKCVDGYAKSPFECK
eukprot:Awhi_evm1s3836